MFLPYMHVNMFIQQCRQARCIGASRPILPTGLSNPAAIVGELNMPSFNLSTLRLSNLQQLLKKFRATLHKPSLPGLAALHLRCGLLYILALSASGCAASPQSSAHHPSDYCQQLQQQMMAADTADSQPGPDGSALTKAVLLQRYHDYRCNLAPQHKSHSTLQLPKAKKSRH